MKRQILPSLIGFWIGQVVTMVLLLAWALLGFWLYFYDSSDWWYNVAAYLLALLPLLMAGGLTRKFQPQRSAKALWAAAVINGVVMLACVLLGRMADALSAGGGVLNYLSIPGEVLAVWVPWVAQGLGMTAYDSQEWMQDVVGAFLPSIVFALGNLFARQPGQGGIPPTGTREK